MMKKRPGMTYFRQTRISELYKRHRKAEIFFEEIMQLPITNLWGNNGHYRAYPDPDSNDHDAVVEVFVSLCKLLVAWVHHGGIFAIKSIGKV